MKSQTKDKRLTTTDQRPTPSESRISHLVSRIALSALVFSLWSVAAFAANYDIREMTPEVREALAGRQARYSELQSAKRAGAVRENSEGLVSGSGGLVNAENHDRMVIYQTIATQNNLGPAGLSQIKRAFSETIREREGG